MHIDLKKVEDNSDALEKTGYILSHGGVAIIPTSTIYGISCIYDDSKAIERVYEIKQRPKDLPFIVLISTVSQLEGLAISYRNRIADRLIKKYWLGDHPEPLTMIFRKDPACRVFPAKTIAVRLDPLDITKKIVRITGKPIISTSASLSGSGASPLNVQEIPEAISKNVDLLLDMGADLEGTASTILDLTGDYPVLVREGKAKFAQLVKVLENKDISN